jgi:hypothetical protein
VTGQVTTRDGTPLPGAVVTLVGAEGQQVAYTTSAGDGSYQMLAPSGGSYLLICRAPSGNRDPHAVWVSVDGVPTQHDIVLTGPTRQSPAGAESHFPTR